jgi:hypothetical protein
MVTTYQLEEQELDEQFLNAVKSQFKNKKLSITITEALDETDYLLANPINAERLLHSVENIRSGKALVETDIVALEKQLLHEGS